MNSKNENYLFARFARTFQKVASLHWKYHTVNCQTLKSDMLKSLQNCTMSRIETGFLIRHYKIMRSRPSSKHSIQNCVTFGFYAIILEGETKPSTPMSNHVSSIKSLINGHLVSRPKSISKCIYAKNWFWPLFWIIWKWLVNSNGLSVGKKGMARSRVD